MDIDQTNYEFSSGGNGRVYQISRPLGQGILYEGMVVLVMYWKYFF